MNPSTDKELRELDAWIAEHVMGWERTVKLSQIKKVGQFYVSSEIYIHDRGNYVKTFTPTTDHAAAMQVLERCCNAGTQPAVGSTRYPNGKKIWRLACDVTGTVGESAETLPLAICRFARALFDRKDER